MHSPLFLRPRRTGTLALVLLAGLFAVLGGPAQAGPPRTEALTLPNGTEVPVDVYEASGQALLLWLPSEHGHPSPEPRLAQDLAERGVEVWQADLFAAYFLPVQPSSVEAMEADDVAALIQAAHARTGKAVYLLAGGRGALPLLAGARAWQLAHPGEDALRGAVLLSPNLYVETPEPGQSATYLPIAQASNLPLVVLQPALSPWRWQLETLLDNLAQGGSHAYWRVLPGVRDRFHFRPDATAEEAAFGQRLPGMIARILPLLEAFGGPRTATALPQAQRSAPQGKRENSLRPYQGDPQPPPLVLSDLAGGRRDLQAHRGQVVLLNFWASWCPPCVHEMPSMERLQNRLAERPFTILAVNMAEERATVEDFLRTKVEVDFPILLDEDGAALKSWKVFAFPTSYLLDKQGRIRYALFGAIDWDTPEVLAIVERLLAEP